MLITNLVFLGFGQNRPFARWRHFNTTTTILFVFSFIFKYGHSSEVAITKAQGILVFVVKQRHRAKSLFQLPIPDPRG